MLYICRECGVVFDTEGYKAEWIILHDDHDEECIVCKKAPITQLLHDDDLPAVTYPEKVLELISLGFVPVVVVAPNGDHVNCFIELQKPQVINIDEDWNELY